MGSNSKTLDTPSVSTVAITADNLDEKALYLDGRNAGDPGSDAKAIVARIMSAEDIEDVFAGPGQLFSSDDLIGKAFMLTDVEYRESDIEGEGPGVYALLHVTPWGATNELLVTCGARNVMAAAFRAKQLGALPYGPLTIAEGKKTRAGFVPLWLSKMERATADAAGGITTVNEEPF